MAVVFDRLSLESRQLALDAVRRYVGDGRRRANIVGVFDIDLGLAMLQAFTQDARGGPRLAREGRRDAPGRCDPMHVTDLRGPTEQGLAGRPSGGRPADDLTVS